MSDKRAFIRNKGLVHYTTTISLLIGSGSSAAIITSVSPNRRLAFAFITLAIGLPFIALLLSLDPHKAGLAITFLTYHLYLTFQLDLHYRSFWESVRNREHLTEQRNRLQTVVDAIPGLAAWIGPDLRYRGVNRNYALNYGSAPNEFLGQELSYRNPDREFIEAVREFVGAASNQKTIETRLSVGGAPRWHLLVMRKAPPLAQSEGEETYIICIDIHEFKQVQSELERERVGAELASKLAALGEITANLAHELRNPLSVVIASTELIRVESRQDPINPAKLGTLTERVLATCARLNKLIDGLQGFSRKTEGEPYVLVSLQRLIQDSVDLVEHHFRTNRVSLQGEVR